MQRGLVTAALGALALSVACTSSSISPGGGASSPGHDAGDAAVTTSPDGGSLATGSSFNGFAVGAPLQAGTFTLSKSQFNLSRSCAGTMCITGSF